MIVSFNIEPEDVRKLDQVAGWRKRSEWLRNAIEADWRRHEDARTKTPQRRKASTPRKKAA